jgi:uncharacterized protein
MYVRRAVFVVALVASMFLAAESPAEAAELRAAATRGDSAAIARLIAARDPLDGKDGQGQTALLLAVAGGHTDAAKALIDAGADINAVATNRDTPWLLAGARGRTEILRHMIPRGPNLALRNRFGGSALIPACHYDHVETVALLLANTKIDVDHVNNLGWTCLLEIVILTDGGARAIANTRQVLDAGANPNLADKDGVTPLAHARKRGFTEIARMIAAKGGK